MKSNDIYDIDESNLGLPLVNLPYEEQLKIKKETVIKLLKGLISPKTKINDCIGMDNPTHYRNKVHVVLGLDRNKKIITGMYQENSHKIIPITSSLIHDTKADEIIQSIKEIISKQKLSIYDEDKNSGLLRHILIRRAKKTDQTMVVIVTSSEIFPGRNNFVKELRKKHPEITTIVQNINSRKTSIILGDKERVLYGKGYITDILCGLKFNISSKSFYQVNSIQTEVLYHKAIEYAHLTGKETVLDAYCGIGT
ncbi:MAG TPA: 23S rRNA (uracil(1939)-C(5))-methyltransferase RlmD, partial [Haloplasmataceae bacterium]